MLFAIEFCLLDLHSPLTLKYSKPHSQTFEVQVSTVGVHSTVLLQLAPNVAASIADKT